MSMGKATMVLFDLDGTLLPMDQDEFTKGYFKLLAKKLAPLGYAPQKLVDSIWAGTAAMVKNEGKKTNEEAFWEVFVQIYGAGRLADKPVFDEYYAVDFDGVRNFCGYSPKAAQTVAWLKSQGFRTALATNPIFPRIATEKRIRWAGLSPDDFELYTTYEDSTFCKPNPAYYLEVAGKLGVSPEECLMVGNDAVEDLAAAETGMSVFLLTDCLINKMEKDLAGVPHGGFEDLMAFAVNL